MGFSSLRSGRHSTSAVASEIPMPGQILQAFFPKATAKNPEAGPAQDS